MLVEPEKMKPPAPAETERAQIIRSVIEEIRPNLRRDGGDCEQTLAAFSKAGIDLVKLAADLQSEGAKSFDESWQDLLDSIETKSKALK